MATCNVCYIPYSILNYIVGGEVQNSNARIECVETEVHQSAVPSTVDESNSDGENVNDSKEKCDVGESDNTTVDNNVEGLRTLVVDKQRPNFSATMSDLTIEGTSASEGTAPTTEVFESNEADISVSSISTTSSPTKNVDFARRKSSMTTVVTMMDETQLFKDAYVRDTAAEVSEAEAKAVLRETANNAELLLGWQIELLWEKNPTYVLGVYVVLGMKKTSLTATTYLIKSADGAVDSKQYNHFWTPLKRSKNKTGLPFRLLRKVAELKD